MTFVTSCEFDGTPINKIPTTVINDTVPQIPKNIKKYLISIFYPLTEPAVNPDMIFRWKITTKITKGNVTKTLAAIINPHGNSC